MSRIGIVSRRLGKGWGGLEEWSTAYVRWLLERGHDVQVVAEESAEPDLPVHLIHATHRINFAVKAQRAIEDLRVDYVHDMGFIMEADLFHLHAGVPRGRMARRMFFHRSWLNRSLQRLLMQTPRFRNMDAILARQIACRRARFLAVSQMVANDLRSLYQVEPSRIVTIPNGVDLCRFAPGADTRGVRERLKVKPDEFLLLFVGHNLRLKGLSWVLRALRQLGKGWRLHVIGGHASHFWKRVPSRYLAGGTVTSESYVSDTAPYYRAADAFVLPTAYDSCSLTVLEALASGLPVVTTRQNGVCERLRKSPALFVLDQPMDVDGLAAALQAIRYGPDSLSYEARRLAEGCNLEDNFRAVEQLIPAKLMRMPAL